MCVVLFIWWEKNPKKDRKVFLNFQIFVVVLNAWFWLILMQLHNMQFHANTFGIHF